MYYRRYGYGRRYKKKKPKPTDLELLGYDRDKLISVITKTTKKLTCSKCSTVTDLSTLGLHAFHSGQYGIYYQCFKCRKNLSIPTKIDLEEDDELNDLNRSIKKFHENLRYIKKNYNSIMKLATKESSRFAEHQRAKFPIEEKYQQDKKKLRSELNRLVYKWDRFSEETAGDTFKQVFGISTGWQRMYFEDESVKVKDENAEKFKKKLEEIDKLRLKSISEYSALSNKYQPIPKTTEDPDMNIWTEWGCPNPNQSKDIEGLEEKFLKPFIAEKERRILLLRKIFRNTKGCIYVLESQAMPNFYKIGWTERSAEERAKELSGTGLPDPYRVIFSKSTNLTGEVEKEIHKKLVQFRHRSNREFFKGDIKTIKKTILETLVN